MSHEKIFALLVGVNRYPLSSRLHDLYGCTNDVAAIDQYLERRFSRPDQYHPLILINENATRESVLQGFREHLGKAGPGDLVWFHFSGHGSRQPSAREFSLLNPDEYDETLILYNSRIEAGEDLADKELAVLIQELSRQGALVTVSLDCCHSGSGTRHSSENPLGRLRQGRERKNQRELASYLDGYYLEKRPVRVPSSTYVLLAACRRDQEARESLTDQGLFSSELIRTLQTAPNRISYRTLFRKCYLSILNQVTDQTPQFEGYGGFDPNLEFLSQACLAHDRRSVVYREGHRWFVDLGAVDGLDPDRVEESFLRVRLGSDGPQQVPLLGIGPERSEVQIPDRAIARENSYPAENLSFLRAPIPVFSNAVGSHLAQLESTFPSAFNVHLSNCAIASTKYGIIREEDRLKLVFLPSKGLIAFQGSDSFEKDKGLLTTFHSCLRWERLLNLEAPIQTKAGSPSIDLKTNIPSTNGIRVQAKNPTQFEVYSSGIKCYGPEVSVRNPGNRELSVSLLHLSREFAITPIVNESIPPNSGWMVLWGGNENEAIGIPENEYEVIDHFLILISKEKVHDYLLSQKGVDLGHRVGFRSATQKYSLTGQWSCRHIQFTTRRVLGKLGPVDFDFLNGSLIFRGHSTLTAEITAGPFLNHALAQKDAEYPREDPRSLLGLQGVCWGELQKIELSALRGYNSLAAEPLGITYRPGSNHEYEQVNAWIYAQCESPRESLISGIRTGDSWLFEWPGFVENSPEDPPETLRVCFFSSDKEHPSHT